ncbi:hypothetical protein PG997_014430 [Apiospora hydei]|uniref:Uncharacterized protein n=1 Tax=Apiospora hydei TaxID=1337664 RepID=A0ABR1UTS3_9PEZI
MATVTVKEKDGVTPLGSQSSGLGANDLQRLDASLEEFSQQSKKAGKGRKKRPFFMLVAVLLLFLVSGGGVAIAVLSFVKPVEAEGFRLARDLVLVASGMSLLYTIIHVRGGFSNYVNDAPHIPPHFRGEYVHASALIVARLGIPVWIAASVATAILISKSKQPLGISGNQIPYPLLDLIICVVALISFITLAATINKNPTPFALAGISSSWILTYQDNVFVEHDDDEAFVSISRRASMQRAADEKGEKRTTPSIAPSPPPALARPKTTADSSKRTTLTEEALTKATDNGRRVARPNNLDVAKVQAAEEDAKTELMANSPVRPNYYTTMPPVQRNSVPPVPPLPPKVLKAKAKSQKQQQQQQQRHTLAPPSRGGGGWRNDRDDMAHQAGMRPRTRSTYSSSAERTYTMSTYTPSSTMTSHSSAAPMLSTRQLQQQHQQNQQQRPGTSSSHYSTASRSQYGPVQYPIVRASGVPWRPPTRPGSSYQQQQSQGAPQQRTLRHSPSSSLDSNASGSSSRSSSSLGSMTLRTPKPIAGLRTGAQQPRQPAPGGGLPSGPAPPAKSPRRKLQRKTSNFSRPMTANEFV